MSRNEKFDAKIASINRERAKLITQRNIRFGTLYPIHDLLVKLQTQLTNRQLNKISTTLWEKLPESITAIVLNEEITIQRETHQDDEIIWTLEDIDAYAANIARTYDLSWDSPIRRDEGKL